jgi:hypothetical protein
MTKELIKTKKSFSIYQHLYNKIVAITHLEKADFFEVFNNLLEKGIHCYEKRNGTVE